MKFYLYISTLFLLYYSNAQEINPDMVRVKIYDTIISDIMNNSIKTINKQFAIDPTINKFRNLEMDEFGIKLDSVKYDKNLDFCKNTTQYQCLSKFEIDQYKLVNVYKDGTKEIFPDFYGFYPPIDSWYNLIYYSAVKHFEKNSQFNFNVILPIRNVSIEKGKNKERMIFYHLLLNENFKILKLNKTIIPYI